MVIFDAVLLEKRILFVAGKTTSAQQLAQFVTAACMLVSPPLYGTLQRIYPHVSWEDLEFLTTKGYIAGAKNPLFKMRHNWFDLLCDIDSGTISGRFAEDYRDAKYAKDDAEFIDSVLEKVADHQLGEEELRFAFTEYVRSLVELAVGTKDYMKKAFIEGQWERVFYLRRRSSHRDSLLEVGILFFSSCDYWSNTSQTKREKSRKAVKGVSRDTVEKNLVRLRLDRPISSPEVIAILDEISRYLESPEEIVEVLAMLPKYAQGLHLLGVGLFSAHEEVVRKTIEILNKVQTLRVGKEIFANLNINIQEVYYRKVSAMVLDSNTAVFEKKP